MGGGIEWKTLRYLPTRRTSGKPVQVLDPIPPIAPPSSASPLSYFRNLTPTSTRTLDPLSPVLTDSSLHFDTLLSHRSELPLPPDPKTRLSLLNQLLFDISIKIYDYYNDHRRRFNQTLIDSIDFNLKVWKNNFLRFVSGETSRIDRQSILVDGELFKRLLERLTELERADLACFFTISERSVQINQDYEPQRIIDAIREPMMPPPTSRKSSLASLQLRRVFSRSSLSANRSNSRSSSLKRSDSIMA